MIFESCIASLCDTFLDVKCSRFLWRGVGGLRGTCSEQQKKKCGNTFTDSVTGKHWRFAQATPLCSTDRDYSTPGSVSLAWNTILDEPLMFWHDWLTKTPPPIKATCRRKWDLCICVEGGGGGLAEWWGGLSGWPLPFSEKWTCLTQETDEQCVGGLVVYGQNTVLRLLWGGFTGIKEESLYLEITDSCAGSLWHILV